MDSTRLGVATAKAMDEIEKFQANGEISEDSYIGAVVIVVAIDSKTSDDALDREKLRDVQTQTFCFSEPEEYYIQLGLLELAKANYGPTEIEDDG